jgi:hypothetical protein
MSAQEFIFSEYPEIDTPIASEHDEDEVGYWDPDEFDSKLISLLPHNWVSNFRAHEALEFFDVTDYISMAYRDLNKESIRAIMKLSIMSSSPEDLDGNGPIGVLQTLYDEKLQTIWSSNMMIYYQEIDHPHEQLNKVVFDGEMYKLTRSNKCKDPTRVLSLFCNEPAKKIQCAWKKYQQRRRDQASQLIQQKALEWLYRPGGPMMKKAETHFYTIAV